MSSGHTKDLGHTKCESLFFKFSNVLNFLINIRRQGQMRQTVHQTPSKTIDADIRIWVPGYEAPQDTTESVDFA